MTAGSSTSVNSSSNWSITSSNCPSSGRIKSAAARSNPPLIPLKLLHDARQVLLADPHSAGPLRSSSRGYAPGSISDDEPVSEPGSGPRFSAGISPALTTLDLPLPLGPTTARKRASRVMLLPTGPPAARPALRVRRSRRHRPAGTPPALCRDCGRPSSPAGQYRAALPAPSSRPSRCATTTACRRLLTPSLP